jgi:uncharacterized membrane protein YcaP (DUF421 family)
MLFDTWQDLVRVAVMAATAYAALILVLRIAGKRALAKLNIFGFAVTVAFGSILATIPLSEDVSLSEGTLALAMLALLQWAVAKASRRWTPFRALVRAKPRLLLYRGEMIEAALGRERVTEGEIFQAVRGEGIGSLANVRAVILETEGSISVIPESAADDERALEDVEGFPPSSKG